MAKNFCPICGTALVPGLDAWIFGKILPESEIARNTCVREDRLFLSWHGCKMRLRKCGNVRLRRNRYANSVHGNGPETILRWEVYRCLMQ